MLGRHITARLAEFALGLRPTAVPPDVFRSAKVHLLDTIGVALAARQLPSSTGLRDVVTRWGGIAEATVWGERLRLPAPFAALINGTLAHSLDFDDTHQASITHPSACVVSAAIASGEQAGADGGRLLIALVAGYEITARMGLAAAGAFHRRGFHATALCGAFGAVTAAGILTGLARADLVSAYGIVASQASGIQAFIDEGAWTKRLHAGWAAHSALMAVSLGQAGFSGPASALESRFGFFASHAGSGNWHVDRLADELGARWETRALSLKPYPCCHFIHACLDAAAGLQKEIGFAADDVDAIKAAVPPAVMPIVCEPREAKTRPPTAYGALFSLPFCVAFILVRGRLGVGEVNEQSLHDRRVLDLAARVECCPLATSRFPETYPGALRILLRDGRTLARDVLVNRGHPENPMTPGDVTDKFRTSAARAIPPHAIAAIEAAVDGIESGTTAGLTHAMTAVAAGIEA